jgi:hypothetical protein
MNGGRANRIFSLALSASAFLIGLKLRKLWAGDAFAALDAASNCFVFFEIARDLSAGVSHAPHRRCATNRPPGSIESYANN